MGWSAALAVLTPLPHDSLTGAPSPPDIPSCQTRIAGSRCSSRFRSRCTPLPDISRCQTRVTGSSRRPAQVVRAEYRSRDERYTSLTADEETAVLVLMPELVVSGWRRLLHNQRALYVKRLLLFEPGVILASVPFQLLR